MWGLIITLLSFFPFLLVFLTLQFPLQIADGQMKAWLLGVLQLSFTGLTCVSAVPWLQNPSSVFSCGCSLWLLPQLSR